MSEPVEPTSNIFPFAYDLLDVTYEISFEDLDIAKKVDLDVGYLDEEISSFIEIVNTTDRESLFQNILDWSHENGIKKNPPAVIARMIAIDHPFFSNSKFTDDELRLILDTALESEIKSMQTLIDEMDIRQFYKTTFPKPEEKEKSGPLAKIQQKRDWQHKLRQRVSPPMENLPTA